MLCSYEEPETMDQKYGRILIFRCRRKLEYQENLPRLVWNRPTKLTYNHWLVPLVEGKCLSTKPTCLTTRVVWHHDTEQNRPHKIPWPCRGLNWRPTAPQARTLPVCHPSNTVCQVTFVRFRDHETSPGVLMAKQNSYSHKTNNWKVNLEDCS